jgi:subtilase family serine protease
MHLKSSYFLFLLIAIVAFTFIAVPTLAQKTTLPLARILGPEVQSKTMTVNVWLKQRDKAAFDELVRQMYDKNSPNYHHWVTMAEYQKRFAPTVADAATVRQHLTSNNLTVLSTDKLNHVVTARGTVADVQRAFNVQLNQVSINGNTHRMAASEPLVTGPAAKLIANVQGLVDLNYENYARRPIDPDTGKADPLVALKTPNPPPAIQFFNPNCYRPPTTKNFRTPNGPHAIYTGARYGGNINAGPPNLPYCGYDATQIQKAYNLKPLYKQKLDGRGQTIVIVDAFGSDTIIPDANLFSQINGLPPLTPDNFQIFYPTGPAACNGACGTWADETSLDVEWSHAVAPGANIALLLAADNSFTNLDLSVLFAIENELGPVISNSYGIGEIILAIYAPSELVVQDTLSQLAASLGMSANFSTGDDGDFYLRYGVTTVSMPAASPYSVAVGGTSLFLNGDRTIKFQTGWGNNETRIAMSFPIRLSSLRSCSDL